MATVGCFDAPNTWCRVCLEIDVRLYWVGNTRLLEIYEKLTSTKLNAEDGRPHTICYICFSQLQRCCRFSDMCHKSEQIQRELLQQSTEADGLVPPRAITHNLAVIALPFMSITDYSNQGNTEANVKEEPIDIQESTLVDDVTDNVNIISEEQPPVKVKTQHKRIHTGEKPYACNICNKSFTTSYSLIIHKRIHTGEKPYACNICNKSFTACSNLITHKRLHTGEKPYACNICNKSFTTSYSLIIHKRIHTGEKPYACNICNKSFTTSYSLITHKRIHTGEKPYACNICNKSFTVCSTLIKHKRLHTGEKSYACNICNKLFTTCGNLNSHKRIHTGEELYACNTCNKLFIYNSNLAKHKRMSKKCAQ